MHKNYHYLNKLEQKCGILTEKRGAKAPLIQYLQYLQQIPLLLQCIEASVSLGKFETLVDQIK